MSLNYEIVGNRGPIVALTPGGRAPLDPLVPLAQRLSRTNRVLLHDGRNRGKSDISFDSNVDEWHQAAEDLYALLSHLEIESAYIGGSSGGCVISLLLAAAHPATVRGLLLWRIGAKAWGTSSGAKHRTYSQYVETARSGGMLAIAETEHFRQCIERYPPNRKLLLETDLETFIEFCRRGERIFDVVNHSNPMPFVSREEITSITKPAIIVPGQDWVHSTEAAEILHDLMPHSNLHPPLFSPEEFSNIGDIGMEKWIEIDTDRLTPKLLAFIERSEESRFS